MTRNPRTVRRGAAVGLAIASVALLTACGTTQGGGSDGGEAATELGEMEGQVSLLAWPGYVEDGSNDPAVDWVTPFEEDTGCEVTVQDLRHLRRGAEPHEDRRVRRRLGVGRCLTPARRCRRRRAREHRPHPELRGHLRLPQAASRGTRSTACPMACRTATARTSSCTTRRCSRRSPPRGTSCSTSRATTPAR